MGLDDSMMGIVTVFDPPPLVWCAFEHVRAGLQSATLTKMAGIPYDTLMLKYIATMNHDVLFLIVKTYGCDDAHKQDILSKCAELQGVL
jgi:hypothetical protein